MRVKKIIEYSEHPRTKIGDIVELELSINNNNKDNKIEQKIVLLYNSRTQGRVVPSYYISNDKDSIWEKTILAMKEVTEFFFNTDESIRNNKLKYEVDLTEIKIRKTSKQTRKKYDIKFNEKKIASDLSMRQAVLETVKLFIYQNNDETLDSILELFNNTNLPSKSYDLVKEITDFDEWIKFRDKRDPRYFINTQDQISVDGTQIVVCSQWTQKSFKLFEKFAKTELNIDIKNSETVIR